MKEPFPSPTPLEMVLPAPGKKIPSIAIFGYCRPNPITKEVDITAPAGLFVKI